MDKFPTLNPFNRAVTSSSALLTYEPYYGLREKPFSLSTDLKFPVSPAPPRASAPNRPVPIPEDVAQPPAISGSLGLRIDAALSASM